MKTLYLFLITGFFAGFINGLAGTGGGVLLVFLLSYLSTPADKTFATTNMTILIFSLLSLFLYVKNGTLTSELLPHFFSTAFLPAVAGGAVGSILLSKIKGSFLKKLFAVLVIVGGVGRIFG